MSVNRPIDMAHVLGLIAKWFAIVAVFGLSLTLSITFFTSIAPPDKPWFPLAGVSLTEGGFILWMIVFMLTHHHPVHKAVALVMVGASAICSLMTAGYELYGLLAAHFDLSQNAQIAQLVSLVLVLIFGLHFAAFVIDLFASYFSHPGNSFHLPQPIQRYEDVRTTEPERMIESSHVLDSNKDVRTTNTEELVAVAAAPKKKGRVMRYLTGERMDGQHGRDCICSSCRPDMHEGK